MIRLLKIVLGFGLCLIIFFQLEKSSSQITDFGELQFYPSFFVLSFLLMPVNWSLEALKWKLILKPEAEISFIKSLQSIVSGVFVGMFTPARIGEYGGRMISIPDHLRLPSMAATFYGSVAQNSMHLLGGLGLGGLFLADKMFVPDAEIKALPLITVFFILVLVTYFLIPFLLSKWLPLFQKYKYFSWLKNLSFLQKISFLSATAILFLSAIRYGTYLIQYYFILRALNIQTTLYELSSGIASIFLLQSGIPLPPVLNFLGRGELSILVWQYFGISAQVALSATVLLWLINLVIPAITGYFLILSMKLKTK